MTEQKTIPIAKLPIKLGQLLKFAELVQDGFEAKIRIQHGEVVVNDEVTTERGKKIYAGDVISYAGQTLIVSEHIQTPS